MCELCGDKKASAIYHHNYMAGNIEKIADLYKDLANGTIKPHSKDVEKYIPLIKIVIRELVDSWV